MEISPVELVLLLAMSGLAAPLPPPLARPFVITAGTAAGLLPRKLELLWPLLGPPFWLL